MQNCKIKLFKMVVKLAIFKFGNFLSSIIQTNVYEKRIYNIFISRAIKSIIIFSKFMSRLQRFTNFPTKSNIQRADTSAKIYIPSKQTNNFEKTNPNIFLSPIRESDKISQSRNNILPEGLPNIGNTCFLNSILQFLYGAELFRKDIIDKYVAEKHRYYLSKQCPNLIGKLFFLLQNHQTKDKQKRQILLDLIKLIEKINIQYQHFNQEDALQTLLNLIEAIGTNSPKLSKYFDIILRFGCRCSRQMVQNYSRNISAFSSLCLRCKQMTKRQLVNSPQYLICNNLDKTMPVVEVNQFGYELIGEILYYGNGYSGHYIARRKQDGKWFEFNDSNVKQSNAKNYSANIIILLYKRRPITANDKDPIKKPVNLPNVKIIQNQKDGKRYTKNGLTNKIETQQANPQKNEIRNPVKKVNEERESQKYKNSSQFDGNKPSSRQTKNNSKYAQSKSNILDVQLLSQQFQATIQTLNRVLPNGVHRLKERKIYFQIFQNSDSYSYKINNRQHFAYFIEDQAKFNQFLLSRKNTNVLFKDIAIWIQNQILESALNSKDFLKNKMDFLRRDGQSLKKEYLPKKSYKRLHVEKP